MDTGQFSIAGDTCPHCRSALRPNAPFCGACGQLSTNRLRVPQPQVAPTLQQAPQRPAPDRVVGASRGVRCAGYLLDLAAMLSPALPLAIAGVVLGVAQIVYVVVPIAFGAVWLWMQVWQGYTGMSFGKSLLGLRLVRANHHQAPGFIATVTRSGLFGVSAGLVALPVIASATPRDGVHDRITGLTVIDIVHGLNPLGARQQPVLRRSANHGLNKVQAPLPVDATGRR